MPLCFGASGSVRVTSIPKSARWASVFQTFWPLTIHSSPSRTARVAEAGEVGAGARLGEQLAPALLAGEHRAQEAVACMLVAAVGDDRRAGQRHEERARVGRPGARLAQAPLDEPVQVGPHAQAADALGEVHPRQPGVELGAPEVDRGHRLRVVLGQQRVDGLVDPPGLGVGGRRRTRHIGTAHAGSVPHPPVEANRRPSSVLAVAPPEVGVRPGGRQQAAGDGVDPGREC